MASKIITSRGILKSSHASVVEPFIQHRCYGELFASKEFSMGYIQYWHGIL
ncbi:hypothetical protein MEM_05648 [Candida albicans L26]|uniref:Uncharacterized protein n=1 Tax=Candida albicans P78048 TaxID=1094989 RepID=A0AB34PLN0_CANAX|nr:hypothetical protein MEU_05637 [Candida albicans P37005]KGR04529.1 hypothetical protein MG3_05658 [Candida albicans P78048]KGU03362.1 hypothetical protein MEM_05648 [Candida albicans L26]KGU03627.1 hypothetical protein MEY_05598 [Candida albicans 19F]KGU21867.1 hypothetical protein MGK_05650 [Candida albicans P57055]KHC71248.1 hypothetical protein W5Q_05733 [Candida albicans SC5314]